MRRSFSNLKIPLTSGSETLRSHMYRCHQIQRMFMCRCCNWAFPDKTSLHIHMQSMQKSGKPGDVSVLARSSLDSEFLKIFYFSRVQFPTFQSPRLKQLLPLPATRTAQIHSAHQTIPALTKSKTTVATRCHRASVKWRNNKAAASRCPSWRRGACIRDILHWHNNNPCPASSPIISNNRPNCFCRSWVP